ncbi:winged helix-turn-helix domain-containing protein [Paraburkholderia sp. CNPSo 3272]|uniref:winged helix-turn-helix domain-containing protein n=1 Tax=Paraburkholderia sp. CNPSo 3272 TaxID=2940931 RepID=UPI0020B7099F|nr:winged helix-turn-helix domain-containing protein [Paraburkholderia sp. CNPSo 3272]MCP3725804.1 winged helix-turn-helix domain-containing protein [Paraburkholderia sp. CNPSo 3272]
MDDLQVGNWVVTPSLNSISSLGGIVRVEPKVMEVLVCLARHPGETVSKEQLFQAVWPKIVVSEDVLKRCIAELRRAFDDDARNPRVIETISKRGYRLVAPVTAGSAPPAHTERVVNDSIAVLPFINMSADPEHEYFADGITEEIIDALAQIPELHVVARSSAFSFKSKHIDLRIVGEQLNVRTVLEGSVRRADNRLRITAQLVSAVDGYHLWSERYDRELKDVFAIQEEIAQAIVQRLKFTFPWGSRSLVNPGTPNLEAYESYLKGHALLYKRGPAISRALACCQRAVDLDPGYALAWADLADCYSMLCFYGFAAPQAFMPKAIEAARHAVALDPSLAEAHCTLALASLIWGWNSAEAEREFLCALQLNPKYISALGWYGSAYLQFSEGRLAEGMEQAKLALKSDPLSAYAHALYALTCLVAGKTAEGVEVSRRAVHLDAESFLANWVLQMALLSNGQFEASIAAGESALAMSGRHPWSMAWLAVALASWGKATEADAVCAEMQARSRREYVTPTSLAIAACAVARKDEAIRYAREAYEIRDANFFFFSRYFPLSYRLYRYPEFCEIIAQMGRSDWLRDQPPLTATQELRARE